MKILKYVVVLISISSQAQTYFFEDFNYGSSAQMDSLFLEDKSIWGMHLAMPDIDINNNGVVDSIEKFKKTSIVLDPLDIKNQVLKIELNKVDPYFYSKYFCSDYKTLNLLNDSILERNYDDTKKLYCVDCLDSPLKVSLPGYKTHMNRNEINTLTLRRHMYKANRDHWFGMNMLIDEKHQLDTIKSGEIVTQFHLKAGKGINPPIALIINRGRFILTIIKNDDGKGDVYDLGPVVKNEWITWKWHIVTSKTDKKGLVEVWRNGEKLATVKGKNAHKNVALYFKLGIYKWGWWDCKAAYNYSGYKAIYFDKIWANDHDITKGYDVK
ncbi:MAG: heparin lyase I family protein [Flavobacteriaceae bacterium]